MNLRDDKLLEDTSKLPQMRYLINDQEVLKLAVTLLFATLHIGAHGSNEKDKIRSTLRSILNHVFNYSEEEATVLKREGNLIGD